jgi:hypothetical protein
LKDVHSLSGFQGASRNSCESHESFVGLGCRQRQAAIPLNAPKYQGAFGCQQAAL